LAGVRGAPGTGITDQAIGFTATGGTTPRTLTVDATVQTSQLQATLVSGTNIKTVNSESLLGSGDVAVQPTLVSGTNIKTVNSTTLLGSGDLAVQPTLVSGTNIKTVGGQSLLGSGDLTAGGGSLEYISTSTPSGASDVFITGLSSVYEVYELHFISIVPSSNNGYLAMQMSTNDGVSYYFTNVYSYAFSSRSTNIGIASLDRGDTGKGFVQLFNFNGKGIGADPTRGGLNGVLRLYRMGVAARTIHFDWNFTFIDSDNTSFGTQVAASGNFNIDAAAGGLATPSAIRLFFRDAQTITGKINLYGVKNS
jgi:hypothetical protein